MKLFISGVETQTLTHVFQRIKPRYVAINLSFIQGYNFMSQIDWDCEIMIVFSKQLKTTENSAFYYNSCVQKFQRFYPRYQDQISYVVGLGLDYDHELIESCGDSDVIFFSSILDMNGSEYRQVNHIQRERELETLISQSRTKRIRLHLNGVSNTRQLIKHPLYSVETSAWRKGAEYGVVFDYNTVFGLKRLLNGNEEITHRRSVLTPLRQRILLSGFNYDLIYDGNGMELAAWNLYCWNKFAQDLRYKKLGSEYFLTEEERKIIINERRYIPT